MNLRIGSIVIRCYEFDKMLAFWQAAGRPSWPHLGLYMHQQKEEVERLVSLGATRYPWRYKPGDDFVVLEDPDNNLFCVVQLPAQTTAGDTDGKTGQALVRPREP